MSDPFVFDAKGNRVYIGDYVECIVGYPSLEKGQRRRVRDIIAECIKLRNDTEYGASVYRPTRFKRVSQHHPAHRNAILSKQMEYVHRNAILSKQMEYVPFHNSPVFDDLKKQEKVMFHIAIAISEGQNYNELANLINNRTFNSAVLADTSADALREKIRARLSLHPNEKWLILSANTIGERAEPPVRFRSI